MPSFNQLSNRYIIDTLIRILHELIVLLQYYQQQNEYIENEQYYNQQQNNEQQQQKDDEGYFSDNENDDFIDINSFIKKRNINIDYFYLNYFNDLDNKTNNYEYGLNGRKCYSCYEQNNHSCCTACKKYKENCKCKFICGATYPCQYNRKNEPTQFKKCGYISNNIQNLYHNCSDRININDNTYTKFIVDMKKTLLNRLNANNYSYTTKTYNNDNIV